MPTDVDLVITLDIITFCLLSSFLLGIKSIGIHSTVDNVPLFVTNLFQITAQIATFIHNSTGRYITIVGNIMADVIIIVNRDHLKY